MNTFRRIFVVSILFVLVVYSLHSYAASGSGTVSLSVPAVQASTTGNTIQMIYKAAEQMYDGGIKVTLPVGWSAPQGTQGTSGYVTATTSGSFAENVNNLDTSVGWDKNGLISFSTSTSIKKEGTSSLHVIGALGLGTVYYDFGSSQDWSSKSKIGFWVRSSNVLALGALDLWISESTGLPANGTTVNYDIPGVAANTWTHVTIDLTTQASSTRNAVRSYGFEIPIGLGVEYFFDNIQLGGSALPGALAYNGQIIEANLLDLPVNGTVSLTYGSGGGANGFTVGPATGTVNISAESKIDASSVYTSLASTTSLRVDTSITPVATSLSFTQLPIQLSAGLTISPVKVSVLDQYGLVLSGDNTTQITLSLASSSPVGSLLSGSTSTTVTAGVATFSNLSVNLPGVGYILNASSTGLLATTSTSLLSFGALLSETGSSTNVTEGGATDSFSVVLNATPTLPVTITVAPVGQASVDKPLLVFTSANWNTPQTVTVTAIDDIFMEGPHTTTILLTSASADLRFNLLSITSITANISDNDGTSSSTPVASGIGALHMPSNMSAGIVATDTLTVSVLNQYGGVLTTDNSTQISVDLVATSTGAHLVGTTTKTAVNGVASFANMMIDEAGMNYWLDISALIGTSTVHISSLPFTVAGVMATETGSTTVMEGSATDTYSLRLSRIPLAPVIVELDAMNDEISLSTSTLTFTSSNWDEEQTVVITALDDGDIEGVHTDTITHDVNSSDMTHHDTVVPNISISIGDNDSPSSGTPIGGSGGGSSGGGTSGAGPRSGVGVWFDLSTATTTSNLDTTTVQVGGGAGTAKNTDGNSSNGYDTYQGDTTKSVVTTDGDEDGKNDFFVAPANSNIPTMYWDPDSGFASRVVYVDIDGDGIIDWEYDADGDGILDHYYSSKLKRAIAMRVDTSCRPLLLKYIKYGAKNDTEEVKKLQSFLINYQKEKKVSITGVYDKETFEAVKRFQIEYGSVLTAWNMKAPSGYVYIETVKKINEIICSKKPVPHTPLKISSSNTSCPYFSQIITPAEIKKVQTFLMNKKLMNTSSTNGIYDENTKKAVMQYQEINKTEILTPLRLSRPTGTWGTMTIKKANADMGCKLN